MTSKRKRTIIRQPIPAGYVTVTDAAGMLGIARQSVMWLIQKGRFRASPVGGKERPLFYLLHREDVLSYARSRERRLERELEDAMARAKSLER